MQSEETGEEDAMLRIAGWYFHLGIMFCSGIPGEGICRNPLLCIDRMSAEYGTERIYESFAEQKRDQTFMGDRNGRYQN